MSYSEKDLERARTFLNHYMPEDTEVAELIADVGRETIEECARVAGAYAERMRTAFEDRRAAGLKSHLIPESKAFAGEAIADEIRALLDEPKVEPRCKHCGEHDTYWMHDPSDDQFSHHFEPEEPKAEPKCKVCRHPEDSAPHRWGSDDYFKHDFEPEEPGRG